MGALFGTFIVSILSFFFIAAQVVAIKQNADPAGPLGDWGTQGGTHGINKTPTQQDPSEIGVRRVCFLAVYGF